MGFNYDFDIAALLIESIVIFFYYQKKNITTIQSSTFIIISYVLSACAILEIVTSTSKLQCNSVPIGAQWIFECLYYTATNSFGVLYTGYCISVLGLMYKLKGRKMTVLKCALVIPYVFSMLIIWAGPFVDSFYPMSFSIVPGVGYVRNNNFWFYILYVISAYYVLLAFALILLHKSEIINKKRIVLIIYIIIVAVSVIIQMCFYGLFVECFGISLASLVFFFNIQKPEEVIDSITEAFNQTAFRRYLRRYLSRGSRFECIALILDDTVFMGNTLGIDQLNVFLHSVADFLKVNFSYSNVFCLNQECFCVLLKNPSEQEITRAVSTIKNRFNKTWGYQSIELKLYSRLCVIDCPEDADTAADIFDVINMVSTDERYKQPVVYAREIDLNDKKRTLYIEHALRNGLSEKRFDVYYQPIYSSAEDQLIGAEALIRLKDDSGHFISPEDFIPIAEKTGTILRIGEFVYESVCRTLSTIDTEEYGIKKIDINLSVAQCMQEILADQVLTIQSIYKIPTSIVNLEITETAAAHTPEILLKNMQKLSDAGFELSLDDYGSGYSNMSYMLNLPFKMIKIDKYIVWSAYADKRAEIALAATIKMIKSIGMTVLAEGVEEKDQAEWLVGLGCDYLQGYYFSRPVPKNEYLEMMKNERTSKSLSK